MSMTGKAATIHKWLALVLTVPILFWFGSGLFFAIAPIERVRSEHVKAEQPSVPVPFDVAAAGLAKLASLGVLTGDRIEIKSLGAVPVAVVNPHEGRPRLYDLSSGRLMSPLSATEASAIARRDHSGMPTAIGVARIDTSSPEYRGALPAWRVDFATDTRRSIYVAADTGVVTARRSTLWRAYDFLWGLHILDLKDHENFNTPLLIAATGLAVLLLITGVLLLPERLGWIRTGRRKKD